MPVEAFVQTVEENVITHGEKNVRKTEKIKKQETAKRKLKKTKQKTEDEQNKK